MVIVKVKKLKENAVVPRYAHEGDAAMDLFSIMMPKLLRRELIIKIFLKN